jgi:ubiquinone/menaquinone biosynthesis C-methylase UbiE
LREYVRAGDHVLDVGAGPGRFTIEMARLGARITVGDISPRQLEMHREKVRQAGAEGRVVDRKIVDITDLSLFPSEQFDVVVCYGGPLSYVLERADDAVAELLRVTGREGYLLVSVMSLVGSTRRFLDGVVELARQYGPDIVEEVIETGDQHGVVAGAKGHLCHMYRWIEFRDLLQRHGGTVVGASASNFLSVGAGETAWVEEIAADETLWKSFLRWETRMCREPGALDGGTHIIAAVRKGAAAR